LSLLTSADDVRLKLKWGGVQGGNNLMTASIVRQVDISDEPLDKGETHMADERVFLFIVVCKVA